MSSTSVPLGQALYYKETVFIVEVGRRLKFSESATATSIEFYHTFKSKVASDSYNTHLVGMACINLAAKACEMPVKLSDVVNVSHRYLHEDLPMLEVGDVYNHLKDSVVMHELLLLRVLQFKLKVELPHKYLLNHLLSLSFWLEGCFNDWEFVIPVAWVLLQDTFHTDLNHVHAPNTIATAVLYLAITCLKLEIPNNNEASRKYWEVFCPGVTEEKLQEISEQIMSFYDHPENLVPPNYVPYEKKRRFRFRHLTQEDMDRIDKEMEKRRKEREEKEKEEKEREEKEREEKEKGEGEKEEEGEKKENNKEDEDDKMDTTPAKT